MSIENFFFRNAVAFAELTKLKKTKYYMNARQFYEEVKKMRYLQKKYFLTRDHRALEASKKFEKLIDEEIGRVEQLLNEKAKSEQMTINFDNHEEV